MKFLAFVFPLLLTTSAAIAYGGPVRQGVKLVASDGAPLDQLGNSVAISDDTLVIGAYQQGSLLPGAAYIFVKPAGGWSGTLTESAKLTGSDAGAFANFGAPVGISGDTIGVGAPWSHNSHGAAYVLSNRRLAGRATSRKPPSSLLRTEGPQTYLAFRWQSAMTSSSRLLPKPMSLFQCRAAMSS